ncbi:MAG: YncE family protein [Bacteroidaceae bacterium]
MIKKNIYPLLIINLLFVVSCDDMKDVELTNELPQQETSELYVLCEGLFQNNNSSLAHYSFKEGTVNADYFRTQNERGLGDTANDMQLYGSKLYIVVDVSSQIEVLDIASGKSIKQIPMLNDKGVSRQPRYIAFDKNKAYVSNFDGTVTKIDTTSLSIEDIVKVGRNPEGLCVQNNKLYVANSGGLSYPHYDNTVSVIDLVTFKEIKKVTVWANPYKIHADAYGDVYVSARGNNFSKPPYNFQRIDSQTDEVVETFNKEVLNFCIEGDYAYVYNYDFISQRCWVKRFNVKTEQMDKEDFITDGTTLNTPYGINVNPTNGDVYITNSDGFTVEGDLVCFNKKGKHKFTLRNVGLNPNTTVFINKEIETK